jgi:hypothetical protein
MRAIGDPGAYYSYFGERPDWLVAREVTRDADVIDRSNFRVMERLLVEGHPRDAAVERASHWGSGWTDKIIVRPGSQAATLAGRLREQLTDYPILSDDDLSELEMEDHFEHLEDAKRYGPWVNDCMVCEGDAQEHRYHEERGERDEYCWLCDVEDERVVWALAEQED